MTEINDSQDYAV